MKHVMKDGELYEADTLNQVWPKKKNSLPPGGGKKARALEVCNQGIAVF